MLSFCSLPPAQPPSRRRISTATWAFSPTEREAHSQLSQELLKAFLETTELENGFALRMDMQKASIPTLLAKWVDGERRCCPFLLFQIDKEPKAGPLWLRLTGATGVKDFLKAELGIGAEK